MNSLISLRSLQMSYGQLTSLILTPTRELAVQIKSHIQRACRYTKFKVNESIHEEFFYCSFVSRLQSLLEVCQHKNKNVFWLKNQKLSLQHRVDSGNYFKK